MSKITNITGVSVSAFKTFRWDDNPDYWHGRAERLRVRAWGKVRAREEK